MNHQSNNDRELSTLARLRLLVPERQVEPNEALQVAELQAARLRELSDLPTEAVTEDIIADLPRIRVVYRRLPTSGMSYWNGRAWVIAINASEPPTRQRFTLLHEFKHVMDHGRTERLYGRDRALADKRAEQACDYFAGCVLMPKALMKRAWGQGLQRPEALADLFEVSPRAAEVRLAQLGLSDPVDRCTASRRARLQGRSVRYFRALSLNWPHPLSQEMAA